MTEYSYCESVSAGSLTPWHLRELSKQGRKLGGGIDTPSLCGLVKPPMGWDLNVPVSASHAPHTCKKCLEKLP